MEEPLVKIHYWLYPVSWIYGIGAYLRNKLFDWGYYQSKSFDVTCGMRRKPRCRRNRQRRHTRSILSSCCNRQGANVAMLSRGYKRKSKGICAGYGENRRKKRIGDEPYQIKPNSRISGWL